MQQSGADVAWSELDLSEPHQALLHASAISPAVAAARGYRTVREPAEVPDCFNAAQRKLVPGLLIPIYGVDDTDTPVTFELRPDQPRADGRTARAGTPAKVRKYEFPAGAPKRLDVPRPVRGQLGDPQVPLWMTEGARKADSAASIGLCCVSLAGVWAFRSTNPDGGKTELADFDAIAFNDRDVYVAFDSDVVGKPPVKKALARLKGVLERRGARVHVVVLPDAAGGGKQGLDDAIASGAAARLESLVDDDFLTGDKDQPLQRRLYEFITSRYQLGQDTAKNGFALPVDGPRLVRMLYTGRPSLELEAPAAFTASDSNGTVVPRQAVRDVMPLVEADCLTAPRAELHLRTAPAGNGLVVDLGDDDGTVVAISPRGWKVVDTPPGHFPLFRRTENIAPLPVPEPGGSLEELRGLLNVTDDTWPLVKGWLITAAFGWVPRPWLYHTGPQGSGKSDAALLLLSVLDPREALDAAPRKNDRSDPAALAASSYLLGLDNLTTLAPEVSDWLCSVVTGARDSRRILHTTASMVSLTFMRSGALTGIAVRGLRPDLLERLVRVEFDRLAAGTRRTRADVMGAFEQAHPRILGALFDAVAAVLAHRHHIDISALRVPRMVDYAAILAAHDLATGDQLYPAYQANVNASLEEQGSDDPVGAVLLDYIDQHGAVKVAPTELYQVLTDHRTGMDGVNEGGYWPVNAAKLTTDLQNLTAALEGRLTVKFSKSNGIRSVAITLVKAPGTGSIRVDPNQVSTLVSTLPKPQVNPGLDPQRVDRVDHFQSSYKGQIPKANSSGSCNLPLPPLRQINGSTLSTLSTLHANETAGHPDRDDPAPPSEAPEANVPAPEPAPPLQVVTADPAGDGDQMALLPVPAAAGRSAVPVRDPAGFNAALAGDRTGWLAGLLQPDDPPACPDCGTSQTYRRPAGFITTCPTCYPEEVSA